MKKSTGTARLIIAASIGNALEWFDLVMFGFLAPVISKMFFPKENEITGLLLTFVTFGLAYVARPFGAIWLGAVADRHGRKRALTITIGLMSIGTLLVVITPTYAQAGILGSVVLVVARLVQGLSAGGEFGAATALLVEHMPARKGFMGSWQSASQGLSTVLASAFGVLVVYLSTTPAMAEWAWRLPFIFGLLIVPVGIYIRRHLPHDAVATNGASAPSLALPLLNIVREQKSSILYAIALMIGTSSANYVLIYMPSYVSSVLHTSATSSYWSTLGGGLLLMVLPPFVGLLSDRYGRFMVMIPGALVLCLSGAPLFFALEAHPTSTMLVVTLIWIAFWKAAYFGGLPAMLAELFPADVRASGLNISYSIGVPIFGGLAPVFLTMLIAHKVPAAPGLYVSIMAGISVISMILLRRRGGQSISKRGLEAPLTAAP
ncbi:MULTISPECIES: MFS transporter [unclassified Variovorax]|uniref:MFS transporter n=1 Tax=unclassified Variovorax TaxID=663243 RepID=UPI003F448FBD